MKETRYVHPKVEENFDRREASDNRKYEKPYYKIETEMTFPFDALVSKINSFVNKIACRQCSSCHGCR